MNLTQEQLDGFLDELHQTIKEIAPDFGTRMMEYEDDEVNIECYVTVEGYTEQTMEAYGVDYWRYITNVSIDNFKILAMDEVSSYSLTREQEAEIEGTLESYING